MSPSAYIHGIGTAVPRRALHLDESSDVFEQAALGERTNRILRRIMRLTGIETRYLAALDYQTPDLTDSLYQAATDQPHGPGMTARSAVFDEAAAPMVARALGAFTPEQLRAVQALVTVSCTHASSPGLERPVFANAPIDADVDRWNLGFMGCSAAIAALRLTHQMRGAERSALIVCCELSSLHFQYSENIDQLTANMLFSDGAAALLLSPNRSAVRIVDCRCSTLPKVANQMVWTASDHGLRLALSQELPATLADALPEAIDRFLADNGLSRAAVDHWLVHPGGPQILDAVEECLELAPDALSHSRHILRHYGNMSSPTILFILNELLGARRNGTCVAMAFGPGLTIELALLHLDWDAA